MRRDLALVLMIFAGLIVAGLIARWSDAHKPQVSAQFAEEDLYLGGRTAKHVSLAFNGLAADWYWMRSLQYVGRKIINFEDNSDSQVQLDMLSVLDLRLLPSLLRMSTTLDPQFMAPYEYGAVILPTFNDQEAAALLNFGIAQNPDAWRLYQHLGYIYWKRRDYAKAADIYAAGAKLPGAPAWMGAMSARMKADGGSLIAAREVYARLYEASNDEDVQKMIAKQLMRVDSLIERDLIRRILSDYHARTGRCVSSWRDLTPPLRTTRLRFDPASGEPLDPSGVAYRLIKDGCDVDLDPSSQIPHR